MSVHDILYNARCLYMTHWAVMTRIVSAQRASRSVSSWYQQAGHIARDRIHRVAYIRWLPSLAANWTRLPRASLLWLDHAPHATDTSALGFGHDDCKREESDDFVNYVIFNGDNASRYCGWSDHHRYLWRLLGGGIRTRPWVLEHSMIIPVL